MKSNYYSGGNRAVIDGVPTKVASWVGELGNDAEYREAIKPREHKGAYYQGGLRLILGGIPTRLSANVKGWKAGNKAALYKGSQTAQEAAALKAQVAILFPYREEADAKSQAA